MDRQLNKIEKNKLDQIFSRQEVRYVNNDFTVRYKNQWFQLTSQQLVLVRKKKRIEVEERISEEIFLSLRGKYLNYTLLPERLKKIIETKIPVLTTSRSNWKPSTDHHWRKLFIFNSEKRLLEGN